jgi:methylenetetrahydrofolate dehydrogenase (NADP+)/methenyltetrahydrofolate cyclohydrolase
LVEDDPASHTHVKMKRNRSAKVGMESRYVELSVHTTAAQLAAERAGLITPVPGGSAR